jgi:tRNA(Arg) A34 adenosine deaminase TadA
MPLMVFLSMPPGNGGTVTQDDERFLRQAIGLAAAGRAAGDAPFGSLLVGPDGSVLAEAHNTVRSDSDITAHPELKLARWAARELDPAATAGTTMYTSCQPCGMCAGAIERSGLGRVVFALSGEQFAGLRPSGGRPPVRQEGPALFAEASAVVEGYDD